MRQLLSSSYILWISRVSYLVVLCDLELEPHVGTLAQHSLYSLGWPQTGDKCRVEWSQEVLRMTASMHTKHAHGFQNTVTEIQQINRITEVCSKIFHKCTNMIWYDQLWLLKLYLFTNETSSHATWATWLGCVNCLSHWIQTNILHSCTDWICLLRVLFFTAL